MITTPTLYAKLEPHVRGAAVRVVTPMSSGVAAEFSASMQLTVLMAYELGVDFDTIQVQGESFLPRGRNQLTYDALADGAEIVGSIDSDVGWFPPDLFWIVALMRKHGWPVLGGNYPKKTRHWDDAAEWATERVKAGLPVTGEGLRRHTQEFAYKMPPEGTLDEHGAMLMTGLPAGFLFVHRRVFTTLAHVVPTYAIDDEYPREVPEWFDDRHTGPRRKGSFNGEDVSFCRLVRAAGFPLRCLLPVRLKHVGTETWQGAPLDDYEDGMERAKEKKHEQAKKE